MRLQIEFFGPIQDRFGQASLQLEATTAPTSRDALIDLLADAHDSAAALRDPHLQLAINDVLIPAGMSLQLGDGDRIAFLSPFSGG